MKNVTPLASGCLALGLAMLLAAGMASAQTQWKWRAADGRVQYSDTPPPPGVQEKDILARPNGARRFDTQDFGGTTEAPAGNASAPAIRSADPQLEAKRREAEQAEKAKQKADEERVAKQKADNCSRARGYAKTLEDGIRITHTNDKGESEVLNDAQRSQELARARQVIANDCGP